MDVESMLVPFLSIFAGQLSSNLPHKFRLPSPLIIFPRLLWFSTTRGSVSKSFIG